MTYTCEKRVCSRRPVEGDPARLSSTCLYIMYGCLISAGLMKSCKVASGSISFAAPVKWLSRHNGAPAPLFHGPLDRLVFQRKSASPITGSWEVKDFTSRDRLRDYTLKDLMTLAALQIGASPEPRPSPRSWEGAAVYIFIRSGVSFTSSGLTSQRPRVFMRVSESIILAKVKGVIPPRLSLGALLMWLIMRLISY